MLHIVTILLSSIYHHLAHINCKRVSFGYNIHLMYTSECILVCVCDYIYIYIYIYIERERERERWGGGGGREEMEVERDRQIDRYTIHFIFIYNHVPILCSCILVYDMDHRITIITMVILKLACTAIIVHTLQICPQINFGEPINNQYDCLFGAFINCQCHTKRSHIVCNDFHVIHICIVK